jgi:hypothetical protein
MNVIYARQTLPHSIFLAGPTPRDRNTPSWRPEALDILRCLDYQGMVFVPEDDDYSNVDYDKQVGWEFDALNCASVIAFWVPRELTKMPAFTTNVEFGMFVHSRKVLLGFPPEAEKMSYLEHHAKVNGVPVFDNLRSLLECAVKFAFWYPKSWTDLSKVINK